MANYNPGFKGTTEGLLKGATTSAAKRSGAVTTTVSEFKKLQDEVAKLKDKGFYFELKRNPDTGVTKLRFANGLTGLRKQYAPTLESINEIAADIKKTKATQAYKDFATVKRGVPEKIKRQTQLSLEKARDPSRIEAEIRRLKKGLMPNHQLHHLAGKDELTKLNNLKFLPTNLNTADDIIRAEQNIIDLNKETKLILDQAKISKNDKIRLNQLNALKKRIKNKDLKGQLKGLKSMDIISVDKDGNVTKKSVGADIKMKTTGAGTEVGEIAFSDIVSKTDPRRLDVLNMATAEIAKEIEASGDEKLIKTFHDRLKKAGLRISCKDGCIVKAADSNPATLRKVVQEVTKEQPQKMIRLFRGEPLFKPKDLGYTGDKLIPQSARGRWFSKSPEVAGIFADYPGIIKKVDVTPEEFAKGKKIQTRTKLGSYVDPNELVLPKSKMADVGIDIPRTIGYNLKWDNIKGAFVNSGTDDVVSQAELKTWAADNPMDVKVGTEIPKPNKSVLKTVGRTLAKVGTPLPTALIDGYFINKQMDEGKSTAEIAKDPLNWLGLATMEPLTKLAGANTSGGLNAVLRLGLNPATIRGVSRFAGLPGLAISTAMTAYDQYKKYQNEEGFVYNLFNKEGT